MKIRVRLYSDLALKHFPDFEFEVPEGSKVSDVLRILGISDYGNHIIVNEKKVGREHPLNEGDVLKILPVVYGGGPTYSLNVSVR